MNIAINETLEVDFDFAMIQSACEELGTIRQKQRGEEILDALFVVLSFRALEKVKPGSLAKLNEMIKAGAKVRAGQAE